MRKRFAPLALLFGLLGALLLGGASVASADDHDGFQCNQEQKGNIGKVDVNCFLNNITIKVIDIRVLNDSEISILENNLNNADVNIEVLEDVVINTLNNFGGIHVTDVNVKVCTGVLFVKQCT